MVLQDPCRPCRDRTDRTNAVWRFKSRLSGMVNQGFEYAVARIVLSSQMFAESYGSRKCLVGVLRAAKDSSVSILVLDPIVAGIKQLIRIPAISIRTNIRADIMD